MDKEQKYLFKKGDDFAPGEVGDCAVAGIDVTTEGFHGNRIEVLVYGAEWNDQKALSSASNLRDYILKLTEENAKFRVALAALNEPHANFIPKLNCTVSELLDDE